MSPAANPVPPRAMVPEHARFPLVDGVRAIAALTIFAFHCSFHLGYLTQDTLSRYLGNLNVGVPIFFVVSGFLLYRPFAVARLTGARSPAPRPYLTRRFLRIVPAYWVALPLVVLLLGTTASVFTPRGVVTYFGFLQIYSGTTVVGGIGQAWTLCVEVTFYLALPLWAWGARRWLPHGDARRVVRWELVALAVLFVASVLWKVGIEQLMSPDDRWFIPAQISLPAFADQFALGMGLAVLSAAAVQGHPLPVPLALVGRRPWIAVVAALAVYAVLGIRAGGFGQNWADSGTLRHELKAVIGLLVLIPAVIGAGRGGRVRALYGLRPLLYLGLISYSFYLWHLALILKLDRWGALHDAGRGVVILLAFAATVAVASLSYRFVEAPGIRLGRRLTRRPAPHGAPAP